MTAFDEKTFIQLSQRIDQLLERLTNLRTTNAELSEELTRYKDGVYSQDYVQRIEELEEIVRSLKKENKILKEREKLIKNKVERLAVKLDKIEG